MDENNVKFTIDIYPPTNIYVRFNDHVSRETVKSIFANIGITNFILTKARRKGVGNFQYWNIHLTSEEDVLVLKLHCAYKIIT